MSDFSFFWHDYETFGRVPRCDRPAQFAGIRTNAELEEIESPVEIFCKPAPDYLPDPQACLLTGITPQMCLQKGVAEYLFAQGIEAQLGRTGTVGVGYNSIRFDDEVTRYLFWRNLMDPYAREWQNQCGRWDILDVVRTTWALRPQGITWPKHDDGKPSFKLEHLTQANGLTHAAAHDALSDVRATIALARLVKKQQPRLWDFCLKLRRKDAVLTEIGVGQPFLHVSGMYGTERGGLAMVWPLAPHPTNKNELIVWDLAHNPQELFDLPLADIRQRIFLSKEDAAALGVTRLPIKTIHINKSPIVMGNLQILNDALAQQWGIDKPKCLQHAEIAAAHGHTLAGVWPEVYQRPSSTSDPDVDEDLYGGFVGAEDRRALERLRALDFEKMQSKTPAFTDHRLSELLLRYRARNAPHTLLEHEKAQWQTHCQRRLHHGVNGYLSLAALHEQIDQLGEQADERGQEILGALIDYATEIAPEHS
jgi:exodeoxyribonuclease I